MATLKVSTVHRIPGQSLQEFDNSFPIIVEEGEYELQQVVIPNAWFNINPSNNTIYFHDTQDRVATITPGVYTMSSIALAVQSAMNAAVGGNDYAVIYSVATGGLTVSNPNNNFRFTWGTNTLNSARRIMGFSERDGVDAAQHTSDFVVDLAYPQALHLQVSPMNSSTYDAKSNIGFTIPVTANSGSLMILSQKEFGVQRMRLTRSTTILKVRLSPDVGTFTMLADWHFILKKVG